MNLIVLLALFFSPTVHAETYTDEVCEDYQKIASEFVEMELAGLRWQGSESPACLGKVKTEATQVDRVPASDPALLDPEFLIPDNRKVDFSVRRIPNDLLEVVLHYIGKKRGKDQPVKDQFLLKLNYGKSRDLKGCASWYTEPIHFVMRSRCWKDNG